MRCQRLCKGIECRGACENFFRWWICSVTQRWQWRLQKNKAIDIEIHLYAYACWKALKHLLGRPKSLFKFFIAYETPEQIFCQPNKKGEFYQMAQWYRIHLPVQETQETWVWSLGQEGRRKWQPTLVFLSGEFHGQRSLVGNSPWVHKE